MAEGQTSYVLVVQRDSSWTLDLCAGATLTVGSLPEADVHVPVVPQSSTIRLYGSDVGATVEVPRQLRSKVRLNGAPCAGKRALLSGDALDVGDTSLLIQTARGSTTSPGASRQLLTVAQLQTHIAQETERALRGGRPVAVVAFLLDEAVSQEVIVDAADRSIRVEDLLAWDGDTELLALLPDTGAQASIPAGRMRQLLGSKARVSAGMCLCPTDTVDSDRLIAGARAAARARPGGLGTVADSTLTEQVGTQMLLGADPITMRVLALVRRLARSELPVLVTGETGVGKELIALALHHWSDRNAGPLISINCAAIPATLFESELFGHAKGAFSGADATKAGLFERASAGTAFLDEIGECSLASQAKLLRVLETKRVCPLGSGQDREANARVVVATNRDLEQEVTQGRFRQDLFYRINAAKVVVPPLRDRPIDLSVLARHFVKNACEALGRSELTLTLPASQQLALHHWPGNVRELKNLMDYLAATVDGPAIDAAALPPSVAGTAPPWKKPGATRASSPPREFRKLADEVAELEHKRITQALEATSGVRVRAAALIGMPLRTFVSRLKAYGINSKSPRGSPS